MNYKLSNDEKYIQQLDNFGNLFNIDKLKFEEKLFNLMRDSRLNFLTMIINFFYGEYHNLRKISSDLDEFTFIISFLEGILESEEKEKSKYI